MAIQARLVMQDAPQSKRVIRRPQHQFVLESVPFVIQPFMIAPVLPGETLKNLLIQARVVSDPVKNPLIGWWKEYYFFYVKHRDLYERDDLVEMVLDPSWVTTPVTTSQGGTAAEAINYYAGGANMINWVKLCTRRCVDEYFRDAGHDYTDVGTQISIGGVTMFLVQLGQNSFLDSVIARGTYVAQDVNVDSADAGTDIQASEVEFAMRQWEMLRMNQLTQMNYEDFLATYGIRQAATELHKPELIRYVRDWTYPSNTIDPSSGTPRSALSWSISERADKDRFFSEPGFIFGLTCARPKTYRRNQKGAAVEVMTP